MLSNAFQVGKKAFILTKTQSCTSFLYINGKFHSPKPTIPSKSNQSKNCLVISNEQLIGYQFPGHISLFSRTLQSAGLHSGLLLFFYVIFTFNLKKWGDINSKAFELFRVKWFLCSKVRFIFPSSHPSCFQMAFARTTEGSQPYIQQEPSSQGKLTVTQSFHVCMLVNNIIQAWHPTNTTIHA